MSSTPKRRWLSLLLTLVIVILVIAGGAALGYQYLLQPPQVLGDELAIGQIQKIDVSAPIKIKFSRGMNKRSVEQAFHISPALKGETSWDGNTFIFTPEKSTVQANKQYNVWIDASAQDIFRKQLKESFYQQFETAGLPRVIMNLPQGIAEKENAPITVVFDRPMVPVTTLAGSTNLGFPLKIEPNVSGTYKWLGTNTLQLLPDHLVPATTYKVTVPKGITDLYGAALPQDMTWQFDTLHPSILFTYPPDQYTMAGSKTVVSIRFNQKMEQRSLEQSIDWQIKDSSQKIPYTLKLEEDGTKILLTPNGVLPKETELLVVLHKGIKSAEGTYTLAEDYSWSFSTVGDPKVLETSVKDGESLLYGYGIDVRFTNPMVDKDIDQYINIEPKPDNIINSMSAYDEGLSLHISADFLPSSKYKLTLSGNWSDTFGQKIGKDLVINFETAPLPSDISFMGRQRFGLLNGYQLKFEQILQSINVAQANLTLRKLSREELWARYSAIRNYYYGEDRPMVGQLLSSWTVNSPNPLNQVVQIPVDITNKVQNSGTYVMTLKGKDMPLQDQTFVISKTSLVFKVGADQALVWATDIKTGLPVPGMSIDIQDNVNHTILAGVTDQNGLFMQNWPADIRGSLQNYNNLDLLVFATKDGDFAVTGNGSIWSQGIEPWQFNISPGYVESMRTYTITDRPLYLPGQSVFWKTMARTEVDGKYQLVPTGTRAHVVVTNSKGDVIVEKDMTLDEHSTVQDSFALANDAQVGSYYIQVEIDNHYASAYFQVQEYKKPLFKLDIGSDHEDYIQGDEAKVTVDARYFFGSSLANAKVHYRVTSDDYFFYRFDESGPSYNFTDYDSACFYCDWEGRMDKTRMEGNGYTNSDGKFTWTIPTKFTDEKESQVFNVNVEIKDPTTQETVWTTMQFVVHKSDTYVGIASDVYLIKKGETARFPLVTTNVLGNAIANVSGNVDLYQRTYKVIKKKAVDGYFYFETSYDDKLMKTVAFVSGSDGRSQATFTIADGGDYHIVARVRDNKDHEAKAATNITVSSDQYISWDRGNSDRMEIIPDKKSYAIGDTAKLVVKSPYEGVKALLTVERNNIIEKRIVDLPTTATVLEVPLKEEYLPNVFVSVVAVKGNGQDNVPGFKVGYINLRIDNVARALKVTMTPDKQIYHPKDMVSLDVLVTDQKGKPMVGDFALAVVDESLLAILGEGRDDILERFFGQRSLVVQTYANLVNLIDRIDVQKGGGAKGGDGNEALNKRSNFKDTAYFNAHVVTDANGRAKVQFNLPDNITSWQLWMVGATADTYVGSEKIHVVARKDVFVEPMIPQFLVEGDHLQVGAIVQNLTDNGVVGKISLTVKGSNLTSNNQEQAISIGASNKNTASWTVEVPNQSKQIVFTYTFKNDQYEDIVEKTIPVYPYWTRQTVSFGNVVRGKTLEEIVLPLGTIQEEGNLKVNIASSLLDISKDLLPQYTEDYYHSLYSDLTVATIGGLYKQVALRSDQKADNQWTKAVPSRIQSIYNYQRGDGGFSYYPRDIESDPYLSAQILEAFTILKANYTVDEWVENRLRDYLSNYYANTELVLAEDVNAYAGSRREDAELRLRSDADTLAYIANVMGTDAERGLSLQHLEEHQDKLSLWGQAQLAMAAHAQKRDDIANKLKQAIENKLLTTATQAHFEEDSYNPWTLASPIRTNEAILRMYLYLNGDERVEANLIRYILRSRTEQGFRSQAELIDWLKISAEFLQFKGMNKNVNWVLALNEKNIPTETKITASGIESQITVPLTDFQGNGGINALTFDHTGTGALFYEGLLTYQVAGIEASPVTQGLGVYREYNKLSDNENRTSITSAKVGEDIKVTLTVVVPENRYHVVVEDYLPAGLQAYNVDLNQVSPEQNRLLDEWRRTNTKDESDSMENDYYPSFYSWYWSSQEIRADRVAVFASYLPKGVYQFSYLAHTTLPGSYKVRPARASQQFFPDVFGATGASTWQVLP